jgi:hypothetical protein
MMGFVWGVWRDVARWWLEEGELKGDRDLEIRGCPAVSNMKIYQRASATDLSSKFWPS